MVELFVPGRLCLFGEHSDWAGAFRAVDPSVSPGACLIVGTDQGLTAVAEPAVDFEITSHLPDGSVRGPFRVPMEAAALRHAALQGDFFSYAAGVAAEVWQQHRTRGVCITVTAMDLPVARGLSSSAAVCVLTARAFNQVYKLGLGIRDEMELAYRGEIGTGSQCGRMDQGCAFGRRLVQLDFDGDTTRAHAFAPAHPLHLLIVDLRQAKDTRRILADLHRAFRGTAASALRQALGRSNLDLIARARSALETGDALAVGALMAEAQSLFDRCVAPACPSELGAPLLHALLRHPAARDLAWGGKGVGSQGDGAAQFICRGPEERTALARALGANGMPCLPLTIVSAGESQSE